MLKLEKIARCADITIAVRAKDCLWSRGFVIAFLAALGFHLGAILLFHISPFKLVNGSVLPPAFVISDPQEPEGSIISNLDADGLPARYLLAPRISKPQLPEIPKLAVLQHLDVLEETHVDSNAFIGIEYPIHDEFLYKADEGGGAPVAITVAGPLAGKGYQTIAPMDLQADRNLRALFAVQVENRTGQVFWIEPKEVMNDAKFQKMAEALVKQINFEKDEDNFVTEGEIEISFFARDAQ